MGGEHFGAQKSLRFLHLRQKIAAVWDFLVLVLAKISLLVLCVSLLFQRFEGFGRDKILGFFLPLPKTRKGRTERCTQLVIQIRNHVENSSVITILQFRPSKMEPEEVLWDFPNPRTCVKMEPFGPCDIFSQL